ncbi:MAG TPA: tetratricopeptide repeat protein, partial [Terriglobales bacterium]|nr:tetratricopeptide repeat protein [Terriglobales bacterium]
LCTAGMLNGVFGGGEDRHIAHWRSVKFTKRRMAPESCMTGSDSRMNCDVPLYQATTSSLEALRFYRLGGKADDTQGSAAAIPFFKQAIKLDPKFSIAYEALGISYYNFGQADLGAKYLRRAVELSDRTSAHEKLDISASYYLFATRELDKAIEAHQLWEKTYPDDPYAPMNLGLAYLQVGQYEQCAAASRRAIAVDPTATSAYGNLAGCPEDPRSPRTERQLSPRRFSAPANRPSLHIVRRPGEGPHFLPGFPRPLERCRF